MTSNYWDLYCQRQKDFIANGGDIESYTGYEIMELWDHVSDSEQDALDLLFKAMLKGNRQAANYCLHAAVEGRTFEHNGNTLDVFEVNKLAAATGEPVSAYNLGMQYGIQENYEKALIYYRIAAEGGNADGMSRLAMYYAYGHGVKKCPEIAAYWVFVKSHGDNVDPSTQEEFQQTASYLTEELDYIKAYTQDGQSRIKCDSNVVSSRAAEAGERDALIYLYANESDPMKRRTNLVKAATLGSPIGQLAYARVCASEGNIEDFKKYLLLSCEQGFPLSLQAYSEQLISTNNIEEAKKNLEAIVNCGNSKIWHGCITWAYEKLAYIFYNEGNKEKAYFCWNCTDGEFSPRNNVDWDKLGHELYPDLVCSKTTTSQVFDTIKNIGCWIIFAISIILFLGYVGYWVHELICYPELYF